MNTLMEVGHRLVGEVSSWNAIMTGAQIHVAEARHRLARDRIRQWSRHVSEDRLVRLGMTPEPIGQLRSRGYLSDRR